MPLVVGLSYRKINSPAGWKAGWKPEKGEERGFSRQLHQCKSIKERTITVLVEGGFLACFATKQEWKLYVLLMCPTHFYTSSMCTAPFLPIDPMVEGVRKGWASDCISKRSI